MGNTNEFDGISGFASITTDCGRTLQVLSEISLQKGGTWDNFIEHIIYMPSCICEPHIRSTRFTFTIVNKSGPFFTYSLIPTSEGMWAVERVHKGMYYMADSELKRMGSNFALVNIKYPSNLTGKVNSGYIIKFTSLFLLYAGNNSEMNEAIKSNGGHRQFIKLLDSFIRDDMLIGDIDLLDIVTEALDELGHDYVPHPYTWDHDNLGVPR